MSCTISGYLATPEFLQTAARIIGCIMIPMNLFGIFCILYKTSRKRQELKLCMLNLHLWTFWFDLEYTFLSNLYFFLPATAVAGLGIFSTVFHIPTKFLYYLDSFSSGGIAIAVVMLFENRHFNIIPFTSKLRIKNFKYRIVLAIFNFIIGSIYVVPALFFNFNQTDIKNKLLKIYPCPDPIFFTDQTFALPEEANNYLGAFSSIAGLIIIMQLVFFISHICYWLYKVRETSAMSENAKRMQRKFFIATCIQIIIPILALVIPTWYMGYVISSGYINQAVLNIFTLVVPLHGTAATIVSVIANKSYRDFTISLFMCRKKKVSSQMHVTNVSTVIKRSNY
ncbi:unnamed protein product [Caenorhabditis angaria]|uniref:Serpentine Receptor, class H n=1 Tax=Caenorhabditis angaria TaxID=860376 RepID=A0A9P1J418_9PELO|nr:unnamed protein product [Caenorhabditis angaria]